MITPAMRAEYAEAARAEYAANPGPPVTADNVWFWPSSDIGMQDAARERNERLREQDTEAA